MTHDLPSTLTPLQRRCAAALLDTRGSVPHAAAALGMSEKRLRDHVAKAVERGWECPEPPAAVPTPQPTRGMVDLDDLIIDPALQPRVEIDPATVDEYAEIYANHGPEGMDPIRVFRNPLSDALTLTRGFTRVAAARQAGLDQLPAEIHIYGADTDALIDSLSGNRHGQRLTCADKRRALVMYHHAIEVDAWATTRAVAHLIGCSHEMVASFRRELIDQVVGPSAAAVDAATMDDVRDDDDCDDDTPPLRRNLAGQLHMIVAANGGEPLDAHLAAIELDTDVATILQLASTHPLLRATEVEVGSGRVPAVELVEPGPTRTPVLSDADQSEADAYEDATGCQPSTCTGNRRRWMIDQARPIIAGRTEISTRAAQIVALCLGMDASDHPPHDADRHHVDALFRSTALTILQESADAGRSWVEHTLVGLLAVIGDEIGVDWPAIETAADARFGGAA